MHLKDDDLRAFVDQELEAGQKKLVSEHLAACRACAARLDALQARKAFTSSRIAQLAEGTPASFSAHQALEKHLDRRMEFKQMKSLFKHPAWIAAALVLILAVSMAFPPVRALASDFLSLFRVEQVKVVSFDPAMLEQFAQAQSGNGQVEQYLRQNIIAVEDGGFQQVDSVRRAAELAGFTPRLPALGKVESLGVIGKSTYEIKIDSELWNSVLQSLGQQGDLISPDMDGKTISVRVPAGITSGIGDCTVLAGASSPQDIRPDQLAGCTVLVEMPSPEVNVPDGMDVPKIAESVLQLLGLSPDEARKLSQSTDWATTLILPVPTGEGMTSREVEVDTVTGTLVTDAGSQEYVLFWVRDGLLFGISGQGDPQTGIDLANTLVR